MRLLIIIIIIIIIENNNCDHDDNHNGDDIPPLCLWRTWGDHNATLPCPGQLVWVNSGPLSSQPMHPSASTQRPRNIHTASTTTSTQPSTQHPQNIRKPSTRASAQHPHIIHTTSTKHPQLHPHCIHIASTGHKSRLFEKQILTCTTF